MNNKPDDREPKFPIGTRYKTRGRYPRTCTVVDILTTYNAKGEKVGFRYVSTHEMLGQTVTDYDVVEASVALGRLNENGEPS